MFIYTAFSHFDQIALARGNHCEATHQEMGRVFQASQTMTIEGATKLKLDAQLNRFLWRHPFAGLTHTEVATSDLAGVSL